MVYPWKPNLKKAHVSQCSLQHYLARTGKQPRCPSSDEWIKKLWYINTVEYYSAIKRNTFELVLINCSIKEFREIKKIVLTFIKESLDIPSHVLLTVEFQQSKTKIKNTKECSFISAFHIC